MTAGGRRPATGHRIVSELWRGEGAAVTAGAPGRPGIHGPAAPHRVALTITLAACLNYDSP